jgi:hypothetical protein
LEDHAVVRRDRGVLRQRRDGIDVATIKRDIHGPWEDISRSQLRTILFDCIETFYDRTRHQASLEHRTPAEVYSASKAA